MKLLDGAITALKCFIAISALVLIVFISYFNVKEYERVLIEMGVSMAIAVYIGAALFGLIQSQEVMPVLLKRKHNDVREMIAFAEKAGDKDTKSMTQQLREEQEIRTKQIRRAMLMAFIFTIVDFVLCFFFLFPPIRNLSAFLLTFSPSFIDWWNVTKIVGTVWLLPLLVKMLVSESSELNISNAFAAVKERMQSQKEQEAKAIAAMQESRSEKPKEDKSRQTPQPQSNFVVVPYQPVSQENANGKTSTTTA